MAHRPNAIHTQLGISRMNEDEIWQMLTDNENMVMLPKDASSLFGSIRAAMRGSAGEAPAPASRASTEALAVVTNGPKDKSEEHDCPICLEKLFKTENGEQVKEMPCGHIYHGECIEKWLRMHTSCPVCLYEMPAQEDEDGDYDDIGIFMMIPSLENR